MRILYYNTQLGCFDGSSSHASGMYRALCRIHGEENVLIANKALERSVYSHNNDILKRKLGRLLDPLKVVRRKKLSRADARYAVDRAKELDFEPDVLLARSPLYDEAPLLISRELGCPLVLEANTPLFYECCDVRKTSIRHFVQVYEKKMLDSASAVYCVSNEVRDLLEEKYGNVASKAFVVPNGYDVELFSDFEMRDEIRERVRDEEGVASKFVVTFVGSLQTWHGIPRLLEIAERMELSDTEVSFCVLGDGPQRDSVASYASKHGNLIWFGNVSQKRMKELLYASDLGIMPYDHLEHFYFSPLKMYDMVGARLPFIGYRIGQIESNLTNELFPNVMLISSESVDTYVDAISLLRGDPNIRGEIEKALECNAPSCSWDARAAELTTNIGVVLVGLD